MIKPNFYIIGAPKCGTTSLYEYLREHPEIFMPDAKEPNYFGRRTLTGRQHTRDTYLNLFRGAGNTRLVGEASPLTMVCETAAREMHQLTPDAKVIAMVRDPFEMLRSLHAQCLANSDEEIEDFEEALAAESDRVAGRRVPPACGDTARLLYRRCARFSEQLERYFNIFGREQVKVVVFEDLKDDAASVFSDVLSFLGAEPYQLSGYPQMNQSQQLRSPVVGRLLKRIRGHNLVRLVANTMLTPRIRHWVWNCFSRVERKLNRVPYNRPQLTIFAEKALREEFAPEVSRLSLLLDRDFSHWLEVGGASNGDLVKY